MNQIQAYGFGVTVGDQVPDDIQWMPPGKNTITTRNGKGEAVTRTIDVTAQLASRVAAMFGQLLERARKGEGDLPYFDFNHSDGEAAAHPTEFFWGGDDPKSGGIRAKLNWSSAGRAAITGRTFRRFSPEFYVDDKDELSALGTNLGGLVNRAAFKRIEPIWSRDGGDPSTKPQNTNTMTEAQAKQLADLTAANTQIVTTLGQISEVLTKIQTGLNKADDGVKSDGKVLVLETKIANLEEANKVQARQKAEEIVRNAISEGRIPAQNKALADQWTNLILVDAKNADLLPPANPALARVTPSGGAGTSQAATTGEHEFIVKAKAFATENKISSVEEAQVQFAGTAEGSKLYESYRSSVYQKRKE